jgi:hypothetical protein
MPTITGAKHADLKCEQRAQRYQSPDGGMHNLIWGSLNTARSRRHGRRCGASLQFKAAGFRCCFDARVDTNVSIEALIQKRSRHAATQFSRLRLPLFRCDESSNRSQRIQSSAPRPQGIRTAVTPVKGRNRCALLEAITATGIWPEATFASATLSQWRDGTYRPVT